MPDVLIFVETVSGTPTTVSREFVIGARQLGGAESRILAVTIDDGNRIVPEDLLGADEVIITRLLGTNSPTSFDRAAVLKDLIESERISLLLIPSSPIGIELAAVVAARTGLPLITSCCAVSLRADTVETRSQIYGGRAEALAEAALPAVLSVNSGTFKATAPLSPPRIIERSIDVAGDSRLTIDSVELVETGDIDITRFERLLCVGRGIGSEDNIEVARTVSRLLGGELAASRQVTDRGWVAKNQQIGKSGKTVTPRVYLGFGVSGAPEHIEGMRDSGLIIAVNTDPSAPIFDIAHYGTTCDAVELLESLAERLNDLQQ